MFSESILYSEKEQLQIFFHRYKSFLQQNPDRRQGIQRKPGKGVSKPNAVTAYQTCAFRICHLQMVRSSTLSIPYDKKCLLPWKQTHTKSQKAFLTGTELSSEVSPQVLSRFPGLQICIFSFPSHTKSCTMDLSGNTPCLQ